MTDNIQVKHLANGLTILTDPMPDVRSATLGFFFRVGSRHEPAELHGISHFIEHTVFKGTAKRTALEIAIETDRLGGNLDAFTTHEETGFAIKVIDDRVEQAFDLIADILADPRFDEADLKSEQRVIVEEMKMIDDSPEEYLGEIFSEGFFPGHPLGLSIAGTPKTVRGFSREITAKYHADVFNAANLVIAAAGNIDQKQIISLAEKAFGNRPIKNKRQKAAISSPILASPIIVKHNPNLEQAHLVIATPLVSGTDERRYAADVMANIIGGGTSSRLWQKVREERGLAYSVGASSVSYQDCGMFSIFAATSPEQVEEVVDLSIKEISSVVHDGVTADELELAKQQAVASILLSLEDSAARAATLAQSEMTHGRQISVEETLEKLDAVTLDDIQNIAREFFITENVAFAALGDLKGLKIGRAMLAI